MSTNGVSKSEPRLELQGQPTTQVVPARKLDPLPRYIRRNMLKAAIKAGKEPYAEGYEAGYEAAKKLMYEAGFRAGYNEASAKTPAKPAAETLAQPVEIGMVTPEGSRLVVSERGDHQPSEESKNDGGIVVVSERT